jgi:hypothetical protein
MSPEEHEILRRASRIKLSIADLDAIEQAVVTEDDADLVGPAKGETGKEFLKWRVDNGVRLYCARLIAESQK